MASLRFLLLVLVSGCALFQPGERNEAEKWLDGLAPSVALYFYDVAPISYVTDNVIKRDVHTENIQPHIDVQLWAPTADVVDISCVILSREEMPLFRELRTGVELQPGPSRVVFTLPAPLALDEVRTGVVQFTLRGEVLTQRHPLSFHKLSGRATDVNGEPGPYVVAVNADAFDVVAATRAGPDGRFELMLPARRYNAIWVGDPDAYTKRALEYWVWLLDLREDTEIEARVGPCSIYNLHAWNTNGGTKTTLLSFRPLCLSKFLQYDGDGDGRFDDKEARDLRRAMAGSEQRLPAIAPELEQRDLQVILDEEAVDAVFLSPYPELIGVYEDRPLAFGAYLAQVETGRIRPGVHSIRLIVTHHRAPWDTDPEIGEALYYFEVPPSMDRLPVH